MRRHASYLRGQLQRSRCVWGAHPAAFPHARPSDARHSEVSSVRNTPLLSAVLLLIAANLLWAGQGVAIKLLDGGLGPLATALLPLYFITILAVGLLGSAFSNVYSKQVLDRFSGIEILFFSYLSTTAFSVPVLFLFEPHCLSNLAHLTVRQWAALEYLAIFLYGVSMVLFLRALRTVDVVVASASFYLMPLFGVALAFRILGERLAPGALLGSTIVLFATLMLFRFDYAF